MVSPQKRGQVIFADTSIAKSKANCMAVELPLLIPPVNNSNQSKGGFMCVPLLKVDFGGIRFSVAEFNGGFPMVCIDTGSEGYFIADDTGFLHSSGLEKADTSQPFIMYFGTEDSNFDLRILPEWIIDHDAIRRPPQKLGGPKGHSPLIIIGNAWLQAVSITWNVSIGKVHMSHLDANGSKALTFQGCPAKGPSGAVKSSRRARRQRAPGRRWDGSSLAARTLQVAGGLSDQPETDACIDVRFMSSDTDGKVDHFNDPLIAIETENPNVLSEPCLDAHVKLQDGQKVLVTQVFDTGSSASLIVQPHLLIEPSDSKCYSEGTVKQIFQETGGRDLKTCQFSEDANCDFTCCKTCCLAPETAPDTKMRCSVPYCTGLLSYEPGHADLSFPLENIAHSNARLQDVRVRVGRAQQRCLPAADLGVWGCWQWNRPPQKGDVEDETTGSLPYYMLTHLNIPDGNYYNMTFRVWRTDLGLATPAYPHAGRPVFTKREKRLRTALRPVWHAHLKETTLESKKTTESRQIHARKNDWKQSNDVSNETDSRPLSPARPPKLATHKLPDSSPHTKLHFNQTAPEASSSPPPDSSAKRIATAQTDAEGAPGSSVINIHIVNENGTEAQRPLSHDEMVHAAGGFNGRDSQRWFSKSGGIESTASSSLRQHAVLFSIMFVTIVGLLAWVASRSGKPLLRQPN